MYLIIEHDPTSGGVARHVYTTVRTLVEAEQYLDNLSILFKRNVRESLDGYATYYTVEEFQ